MFDQSNFAIPLLGIMPRVKAFFKQQTGGRSLDDTYEVRRHLSDIKPFSRLPRELQDRFLQEAWYECYPEERTIIHQHDRPACFYIILSGAAMLTYNRVAHGLTETFDLLSRGCTFGEKGLLTNSGQQFTVTSRTQLELLVLWKEDFKSIYMTNDRHCSKDDLKFLKNQVPFLRGFPIDRLYEFPHAIQHCSFGPSEVIARDSRQMKHIFVVKKGSLAIWKRLNRDGRTAKLSKHDFDQRKNDRMTGDDDVGGGDDDDDDDEATGDNHQLFSEIQLSGDVSDSKSSNVDFHLHRSKFAHRASSLASSASAVRPASEKRYPGIVNKRDKMPLISYDQLSATNQSSKLSLTSDLSRRSRSMGNPKPTLILPDQMIYVHIRTINQAQYFGLADILFPNQPALTLISNDCECLLLRKSSFVRIASDQYKQNIRRTEIPFPADSVFYQSYHINQVWQRYSKQVYQDACERIRQRHPRPARN